MRHSITVQLETAQPTQADIDTLMLLFKGSTYDEVAIARHRSKKTVETTISRMIAETGVRNSRELIYEALSRGWLTPPKRYVD